MKTLLTLCFVLATVLPGKTQDPGFNETVAHIEMVYKNAFKFGRITVSSVKCEGSILIKTFSDNDTARTDLSTIRSLVLEPHYDGSKWHITYINTAGVAKNEYVLGHIQSEQAALELKQALEKLIDMVKKKKKQAGS